MATDLDADGRISALMSSKRFGQAIRQIMVADPTMLLAIVLAVAGRLESIQRC